MPPLTKPGTDSHLKRFCASKYFRNEKLRC